MKSLVFDTGPIISLATNNLLWVLEPLKNRFKGSFLITPGVKYELIDRPLKTKKFKFEALQVLQVIHKGIIEVMNDRTIKKKAHQLSDIANRIFYAHNHSITIVHLGEIGGIVAALHLNAPAFVIDERTTRLLIENPKKLTDILRHKLHTKISVHQRNLKLLLSKVKGIRLLRSFELVIIAYELGLLDKYLLKIPSPKRTLIEAILWGVKLNGCAVSQKEINQVVKLETK